MSSHADIERAVVEASNAVIEEFQKAPYSFLYETDIQAILFAELRKRISGTIFREGTNRPNAFYNLKLVYCEYNGRVDIACIDPDAQDGRMPRDRSDIFIYRQRIHVGIEIKYRKMGDKSDISCCVADLKKLIKLDVAHLLVLGFLQSEDFEKDFLKGLCPRATPSIVPAIDNLDSVYLISPKPSLLAWRKDQLVG